MQILLKCKRFDGWPSARVANCCKPMPQSALPAEKVSESVIAILFLSKLPTEYRRQIILDLFPQRPVQPLFVGDLARMLSILLKNRRLLRCEVVVQHVEVRFIVDAE